MDKRTAILTLTEKLAEHFGRLIISDEHYKNRLVDGARYSCVTGGYIDVLYMRDNLSIWYERRDSKGKEKKGSLQEVIKDFIPEGTNYLFSSASAPTKMGELTTLINVTPYAIIGDKEVEAVKRLFYKDYNPKVREAISSFGIEDFFGLYNSYLDSSSEFEEKFHRFERFKKEILGFLQSLKYDSSDEVNPGEFDKKFGFQQLSSMLEEFGIEKLDMGGWIKKRRIERFATQVERHAYSLKEPLLLEFLKFVFEIPYEDQNIEENKSFFKQFKHQLDATAILLKEYGQGKYFKDYFELLDEGGQKKIVNIIKRSSLTNSENDNLLWSKGFKDIRLDYTQIYKGDTESFIEYFKSISADRKKIVLKDLLDCNHINKGVIEWLDSNEPGLVREVGLNG
ncbi:MAG: hypothetical protein Q8N77_03305 [Nanoarchaeota archaeon]|nr:hypothetical protein [Nanoarchaeota archaeon]